MKKVLSVSLACLLLLGCVFAFSSCGMLIGTYYSEDDADSSISFVGNLAFDVMKDGEDAFVSLYTYKIEDDEIALTIFGVASTSEDEEVVDWISSYNKLLDETPKEDRTFTKSYEKDGANIILDSVLYKKS